MRLALLLLSSLFLFFATATATAAPSVAVAAAAPPIQNQKQKTSLRLLLQDNNNDDASNNNKRIDRPRIPAPPSVVSGVVPLPQQTTTMMPALRLGWSPYESDVESYLFARERRSRRRGRGRAAAAASSNDKNSSSPSPSPSPRQTSSSRKILQNTRLETTLNLASDLTGPISPTTGNILGWTASVVPALRSRGLLPRASQQAGSAGGCTACVVPIQDAGPLAVQTRDLNDGVVTLNNLASMYR